MDGWLLNLTRAGVVGAGMMAGVFFIFSVAIMPALRRLPDARGMPAMQKINDTIQNPWFFVVFVGTALVGAALAVSAAWTWDEPGAGLRLAGGLCYVVGAFVLTIAYHVPRNNDLDRAAADGPGAAAVSATYLDEWVPWNHVRAIASTASLILLVLALNA
jgi:uncharacterized membrane protein